MNAPSVDIKDILVAENVGTFETDLFIGQEPTTPDLCISLFDTPGAGPREGLNSLSKIEQPSLMIRVRGTAADGGYSAAYAKIKEIQDLFEGDDFWPRTINSTKYAGAWAMSQIANIGFDKKNRPLFTINFRMKRSE